MIYGITKFWKLSASGQIRICYFCTRDATRYFVRETRVIRKFDSRYEIWGVCGKHVHQAVGDHVAPFKEISSEEVDVFIVMET